MCLTFSNKFLNTEASQIMCYWSPQTLKTFKSNTLKSKHFSNKSLNTQETQITCYAIKHTIKQKQNTKKYLPQQNATSDIYNVPKFQSSKAPTPQDPLRNIKAIKFLGISLVCWAHNLLEFNKTRDKLQKHIHIYKGIWTMFGVRWSHSLFSLIFFVVFLLFIGSYKQYGIILIPLWTNIVALF